MSYIHAFLMVDGMGYRSLQKLFGGFGDLRDAWLSGSRKQFLACGLKEELVENICRAQKTFDVEGAAVELDARGISFIERESDEFPPSLMSIAEPPFLLYRRGKPLNSFAKFASVVGTRVPSRYGERMSVEISMFLGKQGFTLVSGLAFGVDSFAHRAALQGEFPTVAVLASGVDFVTPPAHIQLAHQIVAEGGALLSEYPPNAPAAKHQFLWRNRIIAGMSEMTIVVEAGLRSGALSTAEHASGQGRKLFALVGEIDSQYSAGCFSLIEAKKAEPLFSLQQLDYKGLSSRFDFSPAEQRLLTVLRQKKSLSSISTTLGISREESLSLISMLEIRGFIEKDFDGTFFLSEHGKITAQTFRSRG